MFLPWRHSHNGKQPLSATHGLRLKTGLRFIIRKLSPDKSSQVCHSLNVQMYSTEKLLMTPAMTQNAFDQLHHCIKHHSMPLNGNQAQQKSYYMRYSTPAFISSNRRSSKKIKITKWITEWIPPLEKWGGKKKERNCQRLHDIISILFKTAFHCLEL